VVDIAVLVREFHESLAIVLDDMVAVVAAHVVRNDRDQVVVQVFVFILTVVTELSLSFVQPFQEVASVTLGADEMTGEMIMVTNFMI